MINELYKLSSTLERYNIETKDWNKNYKELPKISQKSPLVRIWIDSEGVIKNIDVIKNITSLSGIEFRKYSISNGFSFPALNIMPLFRLENDIPIKSLISQKNYSSEIMEKQLDELCTEDNWSFDFKNKITKSLFEVSETLLSTISPYVDDDIVLKPLIDTIKNKYNNDIEKFKSSLKKALITKLASGYETDILKSFLFSSKNENNSSKKTEKQISVFIDYFDYEKYSHPLSSVYSAELINRGLMLSSSDKAKSTDDENSVDAFGMKYKNPDDTMPTVKTDLFNIILRSMAKDKLCQKRYGTIADRSFPISIMNRQKVKNALEWLSASSQKNKTWKILSNGNVKEILFAYPSSIIEKPIEIISLLGGPDYSSDTNNTLTFSDIAKEFLKLFNGSVIKNIPESIELFTVRKKGNDSRTKVLYTNSCSPETIKSAAKSWDLGCNNIPAINIGMKYKDKNIPYPLDTSKIINTVWTLHNGSLSHDETVDRIKFYQSIELFLRDDDSAFYRYILNILINNSVRLISVVGNSRHNKNESNNLIQLKYQLIQVINIFGLLLYKLRLSKEVYMENLSFLLGKLLNVSDELHILYCNEVRNGDIPPQLVGNSFLITASENPTTAIAQLSQRIKPYVSWAQQFKYQKKEKSNLAGWYLRVFNEICDKLQNVELTNRFSDEEKAQLFIGYMSSLSNHNSDNN